MSLHHFAGRAARLGICGRVARFGGAVGLLALLAGPAAPAAEAQSLLASRGLGLVLEPLDARAAALGGAPLGLLQSPLSFANPAASVALPAPSLLLSLETDAFSAEFEGLEQSGNTARFPLIMGGVSLGGRLGLVAGYGALADQSWAVERADTLLFEGDTLALTDRFLSEGGVGRLRLGAGYAVSSSLAVGAALDVYTGSVQRTVGRVFGEELEPACCTAEWNYSGVGGVVSALWSRSDAFQVAAALEIGGTLEAEPDDTLAVAAEFELPVSATLGGSARVSANTLVSVTGRWSGWSATDPFVSRVGGAQDSWQVTGGTEWDGLTVLDRPVPLRLGARFAELPFRWEAEGVDERALTGGTGVVLGGGAVRGDLSAEYGWRGGAADLFEETYWRMLFSLQILGR